MKHRAPLFGVLAAAVLAVGFWFLLYQPKVEAQELLETETATLQSQAAQLRSEIAQLEEVKANELEIRAALTRLEQYIPVGDDAQPVALRQFQLAADAAGVEIDSVTFSDPQPVEGAPDTGEPGTALAEMAVTMTVEGGYFQLVDLLRRLEVEENRALLIDSINVVEHEAKFPTLATTWTGKLFAVVPVSVTEEAPAPDAGAPADGTAPADGSAPSDGTAPADGSAPAPPDASTTPSDGVTAPPAQPGDAGTPGGDLPPPDVNTTGVDPTAAGTESS